MRRTGVFLSLAVLVFLAAKAGAATLYGSTAAGAAGELYRLNAATGAILQDIGPLNDASNANYPVTGLAFHPLTGVLYGSTGNANTAAQGTLVTINPTTARVTVVGAFNAGPTNSSGDPATMADIGFDAAGNLYGLATIGGPNLYSINLATGQATLVGPNGVATSTSGGGLAISPGGVFYGTPTASRFGTYNSGSGAYTNIANPAKPTGAGSYGALDFDGNVLYGLNVGAGSPPPTHLVFIDPANGAVTDRGASVNALDAIAFRVSLPGDYNNNHVVDAADYTTWRNNVGAPDESSLHFNGNGVGGVDRDDYIFWKENYGNNNLPAAGQTLESKNLPEPSVLTLVLSALATAIVPSYRKGRNY
jgi:hypothetical protein